MNRLTIIVKPELFKKITNEAANCGMSRNYYLNRKLSEWMDINLEGLEGRQQRER